MTHDEINAILLGLCILGPLILIVRGILWLRPEWRIILTRFTSSLVSPTTVVALGAVVAGAGVYQLAGLGWATLFCGVAIVLFGAMLGAVEVAGKGR